MFTELKGEYKQRRLELKYKISLSKKEISRLAEPVSNHIITGLNSHIELLHQNQQNIEIKAKKYKQEAGKLKETAEKWTELYDQLHSALKEMGDIVNWSEMIERDMQQVTEAVSKILIDS